MSIFLLITIKCYVQQYFCVIILTIIIYVSIFLYRVSLFAIIMYYFMYKFKNKRINIIVMVVRLYRNL